MIETKLPKTTTELLWLSDIHLDRATDEVRNRFMDKLRGIRYDAVLLTGDISNSEHLTRHLTEISHACCERPVYYTLGNHDFFGGSIRTVERESIDLSRRHSNLIPLGQGEVIELSPTTALIGHRGWFDGCAGAGMDTTAYCPDQGKIDEFKGLSKPGFFTKLKDLGEESADYFRKVLPKALKRYPKVILGTHVPIFYQALKHGGGHCRWERQPFFSNSSAGNAIIGIARDCPHREIMVHAGHSHCASQVQMSGNLGIRVAGAQPGYPTFQDIMQIS